MTKKAGKNTVRKTVTTVLGFISIILVVTWAISIADYTTINLLNNQILSLNSQVGNLQTQITSLNTQMLNLNNTVNLANFTIWANYYHLSQPANSCSLTTFTASYAGYVSFNVQSSTTTSTYVGVIYSSHGVNYSNRIVVGTGGTAVFPVLPATVEVIVGNTNLNIGANETVTIIYYY